MLPGEEDCHVSGACRGMAGPDPWKKGAPALPATPQLPAVPSPDGGLRLRLLGYGLTTAEITYYRPDHPWLLQLYAWQEYDEAPDFPVLFDFLGFWRRDLGAKIHSVRIAHDQLIRPAEWRAVDGVIELPARH